MFGWGEPWFGQDCAGERRYDPAVGFPMSVGKMANLGCRPALECQSEEIQISAGINGG